MKKKKSFINNAGLERLFKKAEHTKPNLHLTAEEMDKLNEDEILRR